MSEAAVTVIGGGLAGSEAAWQIARRGIKVVLKEMRPLASTLVHRTGWLAELVCSNSFRSNELTAAPGLLKEEMRRMNSLIISCADAWQVPAGKALAVDREKFARAVTEAVETHPLIEVVREEAVSIGEDRPLVIASGPLTSPPLAAAISELTGKDYLYFFDAVAPIVTLDSLDLSVMFWGSRYQGEGDYLNAPLNAEQYERFYQELLKAERAPVKEFDRPCYFESCLPIEVLAERGKDTLRFGPMKPVGLRDPRTGKEPYAVVQLRQDNREGTLFNLVGFQTQLRWEEQDRVLRLIPGLENAEFVRYGVMHRNLYIHSPQLLLPTFQLRNEPTIFFAGQITGVEGYIESAASGLVAGINAARLAKGEELLVFPPETALGALSHYITTAVNPHFQPMHINFGLFPPLPARIRDRKRRNALLAERALKYLDDYTEF